MVRPGNYSRRKRNIKAVQDQGPLARKRNQKPKGGIAAKSGFFLDPKTGIHLFVKAGAGYSPDLTRQKINLSMHSIALDGYGRIIAIPKGEKLSAGINIIHEDGSIWFRDYKEKEARRREAQA